MSSYEPSRPSSGATPEPPAATLSTDIDDPGSQRLFAHAPCAAYRLDSARRVLWWNDASTDLFGWTPDEVLGRPLPASCRDAPEVQQAIEELLSAGHAVSRHPTNRTSKDGTELALQISIETVVDHEGRPAGELVLAAPDRSASPEALTRPQLKRMLENVTEAVTLIDASGLVLFTSDVRDRDLGYDAEFWVERNVRDLIHPDDGPRALEHLDRLGERPGVPLVERFRARHADGHWEHLEVTAVNLLNDPSVDAIVLTTSQITKRMMSSIAEAGSARTLGMIAGGSPMAEAIADACSIIDAAVPGAHTAVVTRSSDTVSVHAAPTFPAELRRAMVDCSPDQMYGTWGAALTAHDEIVVERLVDSPLYADRLDIVGRVGVESAMAQPIQAPDGGDAVIVVYLDEARPFTGAEHRVLGQVAHLAAVAMQRDHDLRRLSHQALHDDLTGLPNRAMLHEQLAQALRVAANHGSSVGIMFLDLDDFKLINDSLGHSVGDLVLQRFASRLVMILRPGDAVARFGGDEFVIVLENLGETADAVAVAERLLADLRRPIVASNSEIFLTTSIGIAISTGDDTPETLLHDADAAMYRAKDRGRACIEVHDRVASSRASRRLTLQNDLRRAIDNDEFELRWQPKIDLASGRVAGAEVLVRWRHPSRGLLLPTQFVPEAEESGLIGELGAWVLDRSIAAAVELAEEGHDGHWTMAVNISGRQLAEPGFAAAVDATLRRSGFPPERLVLELTESYMMADAPSVIEVLDSLRTIGVSVAIDDFGTGYSSLAYLHQLPIDAVKLDRAFVAGIERDGGGSPIATAVVHMAQALGLKVIAEGIETDEQLAGLAVLGCDWVQGNHLHPPLTVEEFAVILG